MAKKPTRKKQARNRSGGGSVFDALEQYTPRWEDPPEPKASPGFDQQLFSTAVSQAVAATLKEMGFAKPGKTRKARALAKPSKLSEIEQQLQQLQPVDLNAGLPDKDDDPAGYAVELQRRHSANQQIEQRRSQLLQERGQLTTQAANTVLDRFIEDHPEWKARKGILRGLAMDAYEEVRGRGVTEWDYLTSDDIFDDLERRAEELESQFGGKKKPKRQANGHSDEDWDEPWGDDDEDVEGEGLEARDDDDGEDDDDDDGRTAGIFGGMESGGKPARGKGPKENPNEMLDDLKTVQRKMGLF